MKQSMVLVQSILKIIGVLLLKLLIMTGTILLRIITFLLMYFVFRKVKNKPRIKQYYYEKTGI